MMIACTRMYNVNECVNALWRELLELVAMRADVEFKVIAHAAPAPLDTLWERDDILCAFMCGWPFHQANPPPQIVAAPIPAGGQCEGPQYCTNMIVRADSPFSRLEDTFGGRIAWTEEGSHSGFNAPRRLLADYAMGYPLYTASIGPTITPRASLNAVLEGGVDIAPLDSYFHMLLMKHEPETAARIRVLARSLCAPIPVLVAAPTAPTQVVACLGAAFEQLAEDADARDLLDALSLAGFTRPDPRNYALTNRWAEEALATNYPRPA